MDSARPHAGDGHWVFSQEDRSFWGWQAHLPVPGDLRPVSLGEGGTPLIRARSFNGYAIHFKDETRNPTGSHKDRPLALAAAHAIATGARLMAVVSAGSTGLSNAAYAARAGLPSVAIMAPGATEERVAPLAHLGARLIEVETDIDAAIHDLTRIGLNTDAIYVASTTRSANAVQAEAGRTIAFEIVADLGHAPDLVISPVGGGGTLAAIHAGFVQLRNEGAIDRLPRQIGIVPDNYDLLRSALAAGVDDEEVFFDLDPPPGGATILNKIAHLHPPDGIHALKALRESEGSVLTFGQEQARDAVATIGTAEGLFVEPSSAIVLPAMHQLIDEGQIGRDTIAVVLMCGSGFREVSAAMGGKAPPRRRIRIDRLEEALRELAEDAPR